MSKPIGKVVPKTTGKRLAIGDVHGCHKTLSALIDQINLQPEDTLFFLGDYVNKGPSGKKVLDMIASLTSQHQVHALLGNHDKMILDYLISNGDYALEKELKAIRYGDEFLDLSDAEKDHYIHQLSQFHHYCISSEYILVHAGFDMDLSDPFLGVEAMLSIRSFQYNASKMQHKVIVHGHVPHSMEDISSRLSEQAHVLPIDNGCVYAGVREGMGKLLCLNLDTHEIISQSNCD